MRFKGWWLMGLAGFFSLFCGCGAASKEITPITNFKWFAVATAPRGYPMEVISGNFFYKGQDVGPLIPSGGTLTTGWGKSASVYSGGPEKSTTSRQS